MTELDLLEAEVKHVVDAEPRPAEDFRTRSGGVRPDYWKGCSEVYSHTPMKPDTYVSPTNPDPAAQRIRTQLIDVAALQQMRRAGLPKPPGVPWSHWLGVKKLSYKQENMALMFSAGRSVLQVARAMGYSENRTGIIANSPLMKLRVKELREHFYGEKVAAQFRQMLPKAAEHYEDILNDRVNAGPKHKSEIAERVLNRVLGKPKETVEHSNKNINDIFALLDSVKRGENVLDAGPATSEAIPMRPFSPSGHADIEMHAEPSRRPATSMPLATAPARPDDPFAAIDSWVAKLGAGGSSEPSGAPA